MARLTWHGHSCFTLVTDDGITLMFDPWLDENPKADIRSDEVNRLDFILCSHGHFDHFQDAVPLALRTDATLVGAFELVAFAQSRGVEKTHAMNIGGGHRFAFGYAKMTPAIHSGTVHGDQEGRYTTLAGGFWLQLDEGSADATGKRLYHAGDTALMSDFRLLEDRVDVALLPIGDNFTMGPEDAIRAIDMIRPRVVVPMHYDTFEVIRQDPHDFARRAGDRTEVVVLEPGGSYAF